MPALEVKWLDADEYNPAPDEETLSGRSGGDAESWLYPEELRAWRLAYGCCGDFPGTFTGSEPVGWYE